MRIVLFSSSEFSFPIISVLHPSRHDLCLMVTTPDRPKGRGRKLEPNAVKQFAVQHKINCISLETLKSEESLNLLKKTEPDFIVIASYGKMIPDEILLMPKLAALNVHPSLLPKYRGASPIQAAILNGDKKTGVTIAEITAKLDSGDIFTQTETEIAPEENSADLSRRLAELAAPLLLQTIEDFKTRSVNRHKQDEKVASYTRKIHKDDGKIDWTNSSQTIYNQVRAYYPWPSAFTFYRGKRLKIIVCQSQTTKSSPPKTDAYSGTVLGLSKNGSMDILTGSGVLTVLKVQLEGHAVISAFDFANGQRLQAGEQLDS